MDSGENSTELKKRADATHQEMQRLFSEIRKFIRFQIDECEEPVEVRAKHSVNKMKELHTLQVKLLQSEETYNAQFGDGTDGTAANYDKIRLELGRALDRIQRADAASRVSGGSAGSSS